MSTSVRRFRWTVIALVGTSLLLVAAFRIAPATLAGGGYGGFNDAGPLTHALVINCVGYWESGDGALPPGMVDLVGYWRRWHVVKIIISGVLTLVLSVLAKVLWVRFCRSERRGAAVTLAAAAVVTTALALCSVAVVAANVPSAVQPLSALLGLLPVNPPPAEFRETLSQVRGALADPVGSAAGGPVVEVLVDSFARYSWTMVLIASVVTVAMIGASVWACRAGLRTSDIRCRITAVGLGIGAALSALVAVSVVAASASSAMEPARALLDFIDGG